MSTDALAIHLRGLLSTRSCSLLGDVPLEAHTCMVQTVLPRGRSFYDLSNGFESCVFLVSGGKIAGA